MKLIKNSVSLEIHNAEDSDKKVITTVAAEIGVKNRNDMILQPNSLEFDRERYPFLYNHGEQASEVIGDVVTKYDESLNAYVSEFEVYDTAPNIKKAIENGAFKNVSVAYYVTDYEFDEEGAMIVKNAVFKEVSLVSVPADPNAKFIQNGLSEELEAERKQFLAKKNAMKEIEDIKAKYE